MQREVIPQEVYDLKDLPEFDLQQPTFADIETDGLYIKPRLIQLYQPQTSDKVYYIDLDEIDLEEAKRAIEPLWTVWQGCTYDFGTLKMTTKRFDDTLNLAKIAYPAWESYKLDEIVSRLGFSYLYDGLDKKKMQKAGFVIGAYLSQSQIRYACADVVALALIWENDRIQKCRDVLAYKVDMISVGYSIRYQQNHLISNREAVAIELEKLVDVIAENERILDGVNCNSYQQVRKALNSTESDEKALIYIINDTSDPARARLAEAVYKQRRLIKRRGMLQNYDYDKCVTFFNPAGAITGRFTSSGSKQIPNSINAQQIPRDLQYIFNSDTETTSVVHADYSTAELRAGASIMQDEAMYKELMAGMDLHRVAVCLADPSKTPETVTKEERQKGKAISFGKIFGQSAKNFIDYAYINYGVKLTLEESQLIHDKYRAKYKSIAKYHGDRWNDYKTHPVYSPLGRRTMPRLGTDAINFATQACVGELTKLALHYLVKDTDGEALNYVYNVVHDSIFVRVPKGEEKKWARLLVKNMVKGWVEMCKRPMLHYKTIPMPVEVEWVSNGKDISIEALSAEEFDVRAMEIL
jgi:hypothetical protein